MITRSEIIRRAQTWLTDVGVPYSQVRGYPYPAPAPVQKFAGGTQGWRTDCSGYVSMAWQLPFNRWTGNLAGVATPVDFDDLERGDMLLFHNAASPNNGSHVVLFDRWVKLPGGDFWIYEQTGPRTRHIRWSSTRRTNLHRYRPYRFNGLMSEPIEGEQDMRGILGQLRDGKAKNGVRDTVWFGTTVHGNTRGLSDPGSPEVLKEAGAVYEVFDTPQGMAEVLGWVAGDVDGSKTVAAMKAAG